MQKLKDCITQNLYNNIVKEDYKFPKGLLCFTPLVSLGTFGIELVLAVYVLYRYRNRLGRLVALLLVGLGFFQYVEYSMCTHGPNLWLARAGFIVIAFLPAIGFHMMKKECDRVRFVKTAYVIAALVSLPLLFSNNIITGVSCTGNYIAAPFIHWYVFVYGGWYWIASLVATYFVVKELRRKEIDKILVQWTLVAYLVFLVPPLIIHVIFPLTLKGHPSIMCGFAILTALILVLKVLPRHQYLMKTRGHICQ